MKVNNKPWKHVRMLHRFFGCLSGKVEYSVQWSEWERLCQEFETDGETVLGLLIRAREATRRNTPMPCCQGFAQHDITCAKYGQVKP